MTDVEHGFLARFPSEEMLVCTWLLCLATVRQFFPL